MRFWNRIFGNGLGKTGPGHLVEVGSAIDYTTLVDRAAAELRHKTRTAVDLFQIDQARWDVDLDAGTIVFTSPKGIVATAPVQVVGTLNSGDSTWLWGWANPSLPEAVTRHAQIVRDYGEKHRIRELTERKFEVDTDESDCWRFAAVACYLGEAQGAYRGPSGNVRVFLTYGTVSVKKA
ncbi:MAG TPA: hypothetical protein VHG30_01385 [Microvirga sp.]|nr:hypothetical protein [Microvirga sp.]